MERWHPWAVASLTATLSWGCCCGEQDPWEPPPDFAVNAAFAAYLCANAEVAGSLCGVKAQGMIHVETFVLVPEEKDTPGRVEVRGTAVVGAKGSVAPTVPRNCGGVLAFKTATKGGELVIEEVEVERTGVPGEGWKIPAKESSGGGDFDLF